MRGRAQTRNVMAGLTRSVMAGFIPAIHVCLLCHPSLACCDVVKAWMPGTKPGMTDERPGTDTQRHGRIDAQRHGRIYSGHPRLACCDVVKTWMASEVGPARLPQNKKLQVGPARLPHIIIHNKE